MGQVFLVPVFGIVSSLMAEWPQETKQAENAKSNAEARAISFLAREVPRWAAENKCYSCHNNGDAARALYTAWRLGYKVPPRSLADTSRWLSQPERWDHNGGETGVSDKRLARIQFASALVEALEAGLVKDRKALQEAARKVVEDQATDDSWQVDAVGSVGSPATYGACLATCQARRILEKADVVQFRTAIAKADQWLLKVQVKSVLDAAAVLLAMDGRTGPQADARRKMCLALLSKGQSEKGGWGPYVKSAAETFDTALVILALAPHAADKHVERMLRRGRAYLVSTQAPDGSWQETTRPAGSESYAQRLSTSGWAVLALLATKSPHEQR
jgi:Squalene-hopene cyclase C-terminal domain